MKKVLFIASLVLLASACSEERMCCIRRSNTNVDTRNINCYCPSMDGYRRQGGCGASRNGCGEARSGGCGREQYRTVREPVEVIYKTTRYRTIYEPKTYSEVAYEKSPYRGESCNGCR